MLCDWRAPWQSRRWRLSLPNLGEVQAGSRERLGRFSIAKLSTMRHDGRHVANDLVCFGNECISWADAFARGRGGWVASLPSMDTDINAICRIQGRLEHHGSSGAVIAPKGQQRCIPNLEFQLQPQLQPTLMRAYTRQDNL